MNKELQKVFDSERPKDLVAVIQKAIPKYDKYIHSKAMNPVYGLQLSKEAVEAVRTAYGIKKYPHKHSKYVKCRLVEEEHAEFLRLLKEQNTTAQEWIHEQIKMLIERSNHDKKTKRNKRR